MDEQGVEVHALSLCSPMVLGDGELAQRISGVHDALARAHERHPKRLSGLGRCRCTSPARAEGGWSAAKLPGLRGFYIATQILERICPTLRSCRL